jgi:hypothetical protein
MTTNRSAPTATVVPILIYEDVGKAIEWLCGSFGFVERLRAERDGIVSHAQLAVAEGAVMRRRQGGPHRAPQGNDVAAYVHVPLASLMHEPGREGNSCCSWFSCWYSCGSLEY